MQKSIVPIAVLIAIVFAICTNLVKIVGVTLLITAGIALTIYAFIAIIDYFYFNSKSFGKLKDELNDKIQKYNELNLHIYELEGHYSKFHPEDFGTSSYNDTSRFHYKRPAIGNIHNNTQNEFFCSLSICKNAQAQPFKYLCKYFKIPKNEDSLNYFEEMLNDFISAEEGTSILNKDRVSVLKAYEKQIPYYIRLFRKNIFFQKLGYYPVPNLTTHFPSYSFKYISAGANSQMSCNILLDISNLEKFISYLSYQIVLSQTAIFQRTLMTRQLRRQILERDNYTCRCCGLSIHTEPNLLLEVDHIIPVSKNGKTTLDNLQTLCWKCNRTKGNKTSSLGDVSSRTLD